MPKFLNIWKQLAGPAAPNKKKQQLALEIIQHNLEVDRRKALKKAAKAAKRLTNSKG